MDEHPQCRMNDHAWGSIESGYIYCQRESCPARAPISDAEAMDFIYGTDPEGPAALFVARMKVTPWCCYIENDVRCRDFAKYQIIDQADPRDVGYTESCEAHVGALLGHYPDVVDPRDAWTVVTLEVCV